MNFIKRTSENRHDWLIINNVDIYDAALISMIDDAPLRDSNLIPILFFKKGSIITKKGEDLTYCESDLMESSKTK